VSWASLWKQWVLKNGALRVWMVRWDRCWIRLLDGMLQLSVAGTRDYELRIPTKIRSIVIKNAAGTDDGQISVRAAVPLTSLAGACMLQRTGTPRHGSRIPAANCHGQGVQQQHGVQQPCTEMRGCA
jgi:hypothetical protein